MTKSSLPKRTDERYCLNANLRKASRVITLFYAQALSDSELQGTQFTLLSTVAGFGEVTVGDLGEFLVMDQTTVTRSVGLLKKAGYVAMTQGKDRRQRIMRLTKKGESALKAAYPMWLEAQNRVWEKLGDEKVSQLLDISEKITALEKVI